MYKPELEKCKGTWKGLGLGLGLRDGVHTATPGLKDVVRGWRPRIFTHKVPRCLRHLINIKGDGWLRLSLGNC